MIDEADARETPAPASELPVVPGQIIGDRYRIGSILGEGGMGVVCAATHVALGTPVAVKLIRSDLKRDPESVLRFLNEARTAASLKGEHIARVHDVGQLESGEPYLVMEHLDGIALDAFIRDHGPLSQHDAIDIVLHACEGLAEAHAVALVHRDIKPANLFLATRPDGYLTLKILDFGISKRLLDSVHRGLTDPGKSLGSPSYMSPEQMMDSSQVDHRADIWSLGILLYELLTKECPFRGASVPQVCAAVLTAPAPRPSDLRPEIPAELDAVVLRCLERDPDKRYGDVTQLADALRPFAGSVQTSSLGLSLGHDDAGRQLGAKRAREHTAGSLPPFSSVGKRSHSRWSWATTVVGLIAAGALLAGLGWPHAQAFLTTTPLSRLRLPWDPVLHAEPESDRFVIRSGTPPSMLMQVITAPTSAPNDDAGLVVPPDISTPAAAPTKELLERRAERAERWQLDQALLDGGEEPSLETTAPNEPAE